MNDKLTAYALNELPPGERAALESQMQSDPALRKQADEIKTFCEMLGKEVAQSADDTLNPDQRAELIRSFHTGGKIIRPFWRRPLFLSTFGLAAAACLAVMFTIHSLNDDLNSAQKEAIEGLAINDTPVAAKKRQVEQPAEPAVVAASPVAPEEAKSIALPVAPPPLPERSRLDQLVATNSSPMQYLPSPDSSGTAARQNAMPGLNVAGPQLRAGELQSDFGTQTGASNLGYIKGSGTNALTLGGGSLVAGSGDVAITKDKNFEIGAANTYTGTTAINAGTLLTKSGSGTLDMDGTNTYTGSTNISGGRLSFGNATSASDTAPDLAKAKQNQGNATLAPETPPTFSGGFAVANSAGTVSTPSAATGVITGGISGSTMVASSNETAPASSIAPGAKAMAGNSNRTLSRSSAVAANPTPNLRTSGKAEMETRGVLAADSPQIPAKPADPMGYGYYAVSKDVGFANKAGTPDSTDGVIGGWTTLSGNAPTSPAPAPTGTQTYRPIVENPFTYVAQEPLSTFSLDVDTASYANVRRFLNANQRPPGDAVRLEELINYFPYHYEAPAADKPLAVQADVADAPWQPLHRIARVAVKARNVKGERPAANFVFLIDVSGSMEPKERLPLIKKSLRLLVEQLREDDRVAIVTYAGESGVALESTLGSQKERIFNAIEKLHAGGSTNGASGIRMAYEQAALNFDKNQINRVILCTDGDFNVGTSSVQELEKLIAEKAKSGVFLTALGVGTDNLHDHTMQALADRGNGNYHYLDSVAEARKVLVDQMTGTLVTVAKDVKVQIEFNPAQVAAYRLIGYEKRMLAKEDFNNDKKDAGEIGAGHTVTALYEIVPASLKYPDGKPVVDELKYAPKLAANAPRPMPTAHPAPTDPAAAAAPDQPAPVLKAQAASPEAMTVKVRYKEPSEDKSKLFEVPVTDSHKKLTESDPDFQFAVSVAGFGMLLRGSPNVGELTWDNVRKLALSGKGDDAQGWRGEFIQLIEKARGLCETPR